MFNVPEESREKHHPYAPSTKEDGNNGFFIIKHYRITGYEFRCMVSDGAGWDHVSITVARIGKHPDRTPTWAEMCFIKGKFWDKTDTTMQLHPPDSDHISTHDFCLHIWRPNDGREIPIMPSYFVGHKDLKHENLSGKSVEELKSTVRKILDAQ